MKRVINHDPFQSYESFYEKSYNFKNSQEFMTIFSKKSHNFEKSHNFPSDFQKSDSFLIIAYMYLQDFDGDIDIGEDDDFTSLTLVKTLFFFQSS